MRVDPNLAKASKQAAQRNDAERAAKKKNQVNAEQLRLIIRN